MDVSKSEPGTMDIRTSPSIYNSFRPVASPVVDTPPGLGSSTPESTRLEHGRAPTGKQGVNGNTVTSPSDVAVSQSSSLFPMSKQSGQESYVYNEEALFPIPKSSVIPVTPNASPAYSVETVFSPKTPVSSCGGHTPAMTPPLSLSLSPSRAAAISSPLFSPPPPASSSSFGSGAMSDDDILLAAAAALTLSDRREEEGEGREAPTSLPSGDQRSALQFALLSSETPQAVSVVWIKSPHFFVVSANSGRRL